MRVILSLIRRNTLAYMLCSWVLLLSALPATAQQVTISPSGSVTLPASGLLLTASGTPGPYRWTRNNVDVVGGSGSTLTVTETGYYRVESLAGGGGALSSPAVRVVPASTLLGSSDKNFTAEQVVLQTGATSEAQLNSATLKSARAIRYVDGMGRPLQEIAVKASPGTAPKDVVLFHQYDEAGREARNYLPYTSGNDGLFKFDPLGSQQYFYNTSPKITPASGGVAFSETVFDDTPLNRVMEQGAPGASWQIQGSTFQGHTRKVRERANTGGEVAIWSYIPAADGAVGTATFQLAPAQSLSVTETLDEDGKRGWRYMNVYGQMLASEVLTSTGVYLTTSSAYDYAGRVVMVLSPEGVKRAVNSGELVNSDFLARWAYLYKYDEQGRRIAAKVPGRAWEYTVYDIWNRVVATQDGNQRLQGKWAFTKYDELNRSIVTGQVSNTQTREQLAADVVSAQTAGSAKRYESKSDNTTAGLRIGYTLDKSWPTSATGGDLFTVSYFDDYTFLNGSQGRLQYAPEATADLSSPNAASTLTVGLPTISQARILGSTNWLTMVNYYDDQGRVVQTKRENQLGGVERSTTEYDEFTGQVLKTYTAHNVTASGPAHTIRYRYTYYDNDVPKELFAWFNRASGGTIEVQLSKKEYNELGQLVDEKLGKLDAVTNKYPQSVDYRYNLRGWLTHLNNRDLQDGVTTNADPDAEADLFGLELKYDTDLQTGSTTACYNGNIAESLWRSRSNNTLRGYGYQYDNANRITDARYSAWSGSNWNAEKDDANRAGRFTVSDIRYDLNGNITQMDRTGHTTTSLNDQARFGMIDQLRYDYGASGGNQLRKVADQAGHSDAPNDFENPTLGNGQVGSGGLEDALRDDYTYDANGNLTSDANKGITVGYNELSLPSYVRIGRDRGIVFTYLTTGEKLEQYSYTSSGDGESDVKYVGDFVYGQGPLLTVATPTGRALYAATPDNATRRWIQEYHLRDHLGNLRIAFRQESQVLQRLTATMEPANAAEEEKNFDNVAASRQLDPDHARTGSYAARLNAGQSQRMFGPSTSVPVSAGDSVRFEVYGRYDAPTKARLWPAILPVAAVANTPAPSEVADRQTAPRRGLLPRLAAGITLAWTAIPHLLHHSEEIPRASIKYDFYDKDSVLIASEVKYLEHEAANGWQQLVVGFKAQQEGYVVVSLQNASAEDAWFDDAELKTTTALTVQENHYDPWGQNLVDIETAGSPNEQWQFNGKERLSELEWIDYGWRMHDPQLGRWHVSDPMAEATPGWSPYNYCLNNPVLYTDPDGRILPIVIAAAFVIGGGMNLWTNFDKVSGFKSGAAYFLSGGVGGVVSVFNPIAGGSITTIGNVGIDAATGHLPNFSDPVETLTYVGTTALSGFAAGGAGSLAKLGVQGIAALSNFTWSQSFSIIGQETINHAVSEGAKEAFAVTTKEIAITATSKTTQVAAGAGAAASVSKTLANSITQTDDVLGHIFRNSSGHVYDLSPAVQSRYIELFENVANNPSNLTLNPSILNPSAAKNGVQAFTQTFRNGKQVWVLSRGGKIFNAGVNLIPK